MKNIRPSSKHAISQAMILAITLILLTGLAALLNRPSDRLALRSSANERHVGSSLLPPFEPSRMKDDYGQLPRRTGLKTYGSIIYPDLWPGIDLIYSGTVNRLKYQFVVKPGADPGQIKLAFRGATAVRINDAGQLEVSTPMSSFHDDKPFAYQETAAEKIEVGAAYRLTTDETMRAEVYGFSLVDYDRSKPLVLDPAVLVYSGLIGGAGNDAGSSIAVDEEGNVYIAGTTTSADVSFPVTAGKKKQEELRELLRTFKRPSEYKRTVSLVNRQC